MKIFILLILIFTINNHVFSQGVECEWILSAGTNAQESVYAIENDNNGNCYMLYASPFNQPIMIDTIQVFPSPYLEMVVINSNGNAINSFISYYGSTETGFKYQNGMMMAGPWWLTGTIQFGNTSGIVGFGQQDVAIWKYDINDNPLWAKVFGGTAHDWAVDCEFDSNNNLYVIGEFESPFINFGSTTVYNSGAGEDMFLAKYDSLGNQDWIISCDSSSSFNELKHILIDDYGYIYITGFFYYPFTFANILLTSTASSSSYLSIFLIKIDPNGNGVWGKSFDGTLSDTEMDTENNIVISGSRQDTSLFMIDNDTVWSNNIDYSNNHFFLVKFDSASNVVWTNFCNGGESIGRHLEIDNNNDIYIAGEYHNWTTNSVFLDTIELPFTYTHNSFVAKYNSIGDIQWVKNITGQYNVPKDMSLYNNDIFVCGNYTGELSIDSDTVFGHNILTDFFLAKISQVYPETTKQFIDLIEGWSIISTYIDADFPNLDTIFSEVDTNLIIMKDEAGLVYWPLYSINNIGDLTIGEGYQVKMDTFQILEVAGIPAVPETTPVNLQAGWNILGYLRQNSGAIDSMFTGISQNIIMAKSGGGLVYWPLFGINNIGNMNPGEGYQIKMLAAYILLYPAN